MAGLCEGGNEPPGSLKTSLHKVCSLRACSQLMSGMQILAVLCIRVDWKEGNRQHRVRWASVSYPQKTQCTMVHSVAASRYALYLFLLHDGAHRTAPSTLCTFQRVLTTTALLLPLATSALLSICEQYGMKIKANKTKTKVLGRKIKKVNLRILNETVEQLDSFKHLECTISGNMSCCQEVKRRIAMTKEAFNRKRSIFRGPLEKELGKRLVK
ncbi:hypothetical protein ANN_08024 [Periplaneta americana]|uniref:Uncharacterized protein n=1 Tax=Periplaneta americana TaxID=6978 RepID=A0ABQ8T1U5_PERAM|nr:hypothetical protein ANN_08024 [Periplaneta americana]